MTFQHDATGKGHDLMPGGYQHNLKGDGHKLVDIAHKYGEPPARSSHTFRYVAFAVAILICLFLLFGCATVPETGTVVGKRTGTSKVCDKYTGAGHHRKCVHKVERMTYIITVDPGGDGDVTVDVRVDQEKYSSVNVGDEWVK